MWNLTRGMTLNGLQGANCENDLTTEEDTCGHFMKLCGSGQQVKPSNNVKGFQIVETRIHADMYETLGKLFRGWEANYDLIFIVYYQEYGLVP